MTFTDPGFDIQRDIVAALKANAAVKAMVKDRVYDRVPRDRNGDPNVPFPYITLGDTQTLPDLAECTDAAETFFAIHIWSRKVGSVEAKQLSAAVGAVLHDAALPAVQSILLQESRIIPDPDGLTSHGILTFQILTDAN
jgi:hypothetical protein